MAPAALVAMALLAGMSGFAEAQRPDGCGLDKKLLPTQDGGDLVIKVDCTVGAGTYKFRNVNILAGLTAAPWDVSLGTITVSDGVCPKPADTLAADFCP